MVLMSARGRALLLMAAMLVALTLLATSFGSLEFETGRRVSFTVEADATEVAESEEVAPVEEVPTSPARRLLYVIFIYVVIPASLFYTVFTRSGRESLRRALINAIAAVAIYIVIIRVIERLNLSQATRDIGEGTIVLSLDSMPPAFVAALSFSISTTLIVIAVLLYLRWRMRPQPVVTVQVRAKEAIAEIKAGGELRSIILRCYHDMLHTVRERVGIERLEHVTPREFEDHLIEIGLPSADIQQLTRLFERVRYGESDTDSASERNRAVHCLNTIVHAIEGQA